MLNKYIVIRRLHSLETLIVMGFTDWLSPGWLCKRSGWAEPGGQSRSLFISFSSDPLFVLNSSRPFSGQTHAGSF
jgi:hypothetical protein